MTFDLDSDFRPFPALEQIPFTKFRFPAGEAHLRITSHIASDKVIITHRASSFEALGEILLAVDALRRLGVKHLELVLPYFPAARQDRVMIFGEPLTVKVYTDIINAQGFEKVTLFDPHSDVTPALLDSCQVISNTPFIKEVISDLPSDTYLISPDGGALKKIYKLAQDLKDYDVVECSKSRNVQTGEISKFTVYQDDLQARPCLIVDDICDGGGTFLGLAKALKAKNAGPLYLAVSHGIFSKGLEQLCEVFEKIYTTNSFTDHPLSPQLIQVPLEDKVVV
ncbi:ribose-phosphate pyrophosphokinase [Robertkochia marina]|uniref:Ribose-phosphate pyrophosphokinase n=1 Tax=Robertkochia marina TaxID=1227945 RepID=A0A4S3M2B3_9FLAO|nr:ribose-phosphate diphosphokinase [Robertkochia marina]THD67615.1 ribose-phosphate pyrophosphokinase [Robertkochia marina]TRZ43347.1 ribose-phosphate pyrophosphokinase [Robertkochia marina]